MKIAVRTQAENKQTFEAATKSQLGKLKDLVDKLDASKENQKKLTDLYLEYGKTVDISYLKDFLSKVPDACYFNCQTRLLNDDASAFLLALSQDEAETTGDFGIKPVDIAAIFAVENIRNQAEKLDGKKYNSKKELGKLMQVSPRLARYTGIIEGGDDQTQSQIEEKIIFDTAKVRNAFSLAFNEIKDDLATCLAKQLNCADCGDKKAEALRDKLNDLVFKNILKNATQAESVTMDSNLKGKIGEIPFDLNNYQKGNVPRWTCTKGEMVADPCTKKLIPCPVN